MSKLIEFQQHIRTSSKVRRGFRTYQTSESIDSETDRNLSSYGVYTPTAYEDSMTMQPDDYPEMFVFYQLDDGRKVVCKSKYIGLDLHSYPPRAGNYISHALVCNRKTPFNPVEVYERAEWKTGREVEENDSGYVPEHISDLLVDVDPNFHDDQWIRSLLVSPDHSIAPEREKTALAIRKKMFKIAIDAILNKQKIVIIDHKEKLLDWTMTLLQVFPLEFVFNEMTIASFVNSRELLDLCSILCFEKENVERIRRHLSKVIVIDFDKPEDHKASPYAEALTHAILHADLASFRKKVFTPIVESRRYTPDTFNTYVDIYDKFNQVPEMGGAGLEELLKKFAHDKTQIDEIFHAIPEKQLAEKCPVVWKVLRKGKNITPDDLAAYRGLADYTFPPFTDDSWIDFEGGISGELHFRTLKEVDQFFDVLPNLEYTDIRRANYFAAVISIISNSKDPAVIDDGILAIERRCLPLSGEQIHRLEEIKSFSDVVRSLDACEGIEQYTLAGRSLLALPPSLRNKAQQLLPRMDWRIFFDLLETDKDLLDDFFATGIAGEGLRKEIALLILKGRHVADPDLLRSTYNTLPPVEKEDFAAYATPALREILIAKMTLNTVKKLEENLQLYSTLKDTIIKKFLDQADKLLYVDWWQLCSIVFRPSEHMSIYPNIINQVREEMLTPIYLLLEKEEIGIPNGYIQLAGLLQRKGYLKRPVPRNEMVFTTEELRSLGTLGDIARVGDIIRRRERFDHDVLLDLIKVPWLYLSWEALFDQLGQEDKQRLPNILKDLLNDVERNRDKDSHAKAGYRYSLERWKNIVCQYFVFLIVKDLREHLINLLRHHLIDWGDHTFIKRTVSTILYEGNATFALFKDTDNSFFTVRTVPTWNLKNV